MIEDLIKKGLLVKMQQDEQKASSSLELAEGRVEKGKAELKVEFFDDALLSAYTSMFHSCRALMFRDGFKERSHYAVCEYIREKYPDKIEAKYINELNILRTLRHKIIYGDENLLPKEVQEAEAESSIKLAEGFLAAVKKLLKGK